MKPWEENSISPGSLGNIRVDMESIYSEFALYDRRRMINDDDINTTITTTMMTKTTQLKKIYVYISGVQ